MKRSMAASAGDEDFRRIKLGKAVKDEERECHGAGFLSTDENILYEVLKHVDARSLAMAACVSKLWHRTAQDERLWELICTRHWNQVGCSTQKLRSVVLVLGGFRRLHSLYIWPLSKPTPSPSPSPASTSSSLWSSLPPPSLPTAFPVKPPPKTNVRLGKDEVNLSLSLLSVRYFERMSFTAKDDQRSQEKN